MAINFMYKKIGCGLKQSGVTMVEALVAMLLFSVGALGLAAMQLSSFVNSGDSQQRSVAVFKAQELASRIKSNPEELSTYIARVGSSNVSIIGKDTPDTSSYVVCGSSSYTKPAKLCSDSSATQATACTNAQQVNFDLWEIFCDPNTGAAIFTDADNTSLEGSSGLVNLELVLRQNNDTDDGNSDVAIYMEWLSRQGEQETGADTTDVFYGSELCGLDEDGDDIADVVNIDSDLDVYCMRFRVR